MGRFQCRWSVIALIAIIMTLFGGTALLGAIETAPSDVVILLDNDISMDMTTIPNIAACPCLNPNHYYIDPEDASHNQRFTTSFPDDGSELWRYHYNSNEILISVLERDEKGNLRCEAANEQKGCYDRRILGHKAVIDIMQEILSQNTANRIAYIPFNDKNHEIEFTSDMEILNAALETTVSSEDTSDEKALQKAYSLLEKRTPQEKQERTAHIIVITGNQSRKLKEQNMLLSISESLLQTISKKDTSLQDHVLIHTIDLSDEEAQITVKKKNQTLYHTGSDREAIHRSVQKITASILMGEIP